MYGNHYLEKRFIERVTKQDNDLTIKSDNSKSTILSSYYSRQNKESAAIAQNINNYANPS